MKHIEKLVQGKGSMNRLTAHSDAGHGWLSCKRSLLVKLDLTDKITRFSYQRGQSVYLEEDCDAGTLIKALEAQGLAFKILTGAYQNYSKIRSFDHYSTNV